MESASFVLLETRDASAFVNRHDNDLSITSDDDVGARGGSITQIEALPGNTMTERLEIEITSSRAHPFRDELITLLMTYLHGHRLGLLYVT
jgi:hypothetical protein